MLPRARARGLRGLRGPPAVRGGRAIFGPPPNLEELVTRPLETAAEQGRQAVNAALALSGSAVKFRGPGAAAVRTDSRTAAAEKPVQRTSLFWDPYKLDSPFRMGREAYIAKHLARPVDSRSLLPDRDVESYVDLLLSKDVLSNVSLPPGMGRQLYIRVVRIVQRVILNGISLVEGEVLGKQMRILKDASCVSQFRHSGQAEVDPSVMRLLAKRICEDHVIDGKFVSPYLHELGLPTALVERLYEDMIALSVRLVLDVSLTFKVRCLGHSLTCQITPDDLLETAPGWQVALEQGAFGLFDDGEKRRWAQMFVEDLLKDEAVKIQELPETVQQQLYKRVALMMLNLGETAMNHFRIHLAGMAFRPVLLDEPS